MINLFHLVWIDPVSGIIGYVVAVFCKAATEADADYDTIIGEDQWEDTLT